jgi:hypothetical protein
VAPVVQELRNVLDHEGEWSERLDVGQVAQIEVASRVLQIGIGMGEDLTQLRSADARVGLTRGPSDEDVDRLSLRVKTELVGQGLGILPRDISRRSMFRADRGRCITKKVHGM